MWQSQCSYALNYFCNVELMALYAFLAENDVTSFNVTTLRQSGCNLAGSDATSPLSMHSKHIP